VFYAQLLEKWWLWVNRHAIVSNQDYELPYSETKTEKAVGECNRLVTAYGRIPGNTGEKVTPETRNRFHKSRASTPREKIHRGVRRRQILSKRERKGTKLNPTTDV